MGMKLEKAQQCPFCKEWKQASKIDSHQKMCAYRDENEEMKEEQKNVPQLHPVPKHAITSSQK